MLLHPPALSGISTRELFFRIIGRTLEYEAASMCGYWQYLFTKNYGNIEFSPKYRGCAIVLIPVKCGGLDRKPKKSEDPAKNWILGPISAYLAPKKGHFGSFGPNNGLFSGRMGRCPKSEGVTRVPQDVGKRWSQVRST